VKELIYKDFRLMLRSKKLMFPLVCMFFYGFVKPDSIVMVLTYITMVFCLLGFNSLSLEEYDNCIEYFLTMPLDRKVYVQEKYLFATITTFVGWLASTIILGFVYNGDLVEYVVQALVIFMSMMLFQCIMLPFQIKYGGEKSRIMLLSCIAVIMGITAVLTYFLNSVTNVSDHTVEIILKLNDFLMKWGGILGMAAFFIIIYVSYKLSVKFMKQKEY
jgi:hypothetical protein